VVPGAEGDPVGIDRVEHPHEYGINAVMLDAAQATYAL
jgi:hypothetical protein